MRKIYLTYLKWAESAGLDAETRLAGLKLMIEAEEDPYRSRLEMPRRSKHAEAQARYQARKDAERDDQNLIRNDQQNDQAPISSLSSLTTDSKKEESKKERKGSGETTPIDRWTLSEGILDYGRDLGLDGDEVREIADDMRDWARANAHRSIARKKCWDSTIRAWMRKLAKQRKADVQADKSKLSAAKRAFDRMQNLATGSFFEDRGNVVMLPQIGRCEHGAAGGGGGSSDGISAGCSSIGHSSDNRAGNGIGLVPDREAVPGSLRAADGSPAANGARKADTS